MYPTLYHALLDLFGLDLPFLKLVNSFGFFVALAFVTASILLKVEMKRMEQKGIFPAQRVKQVIGSGPQWGEILTNAVLGFFLGWKMIFLFVNSEVIFAHGMAQKALMSGDGYPLLGLLLAIALGVGSIGKIKKRNCHNPRNNGLRSQLI